MPFDSILSASSMAALSSFSKAPRSLAASDFLASIAAMASARSSMILHRSAVATSTILPSTSTDAVPLLTPSSEEALRSSP